MYGCACLVDVLGSGCEEEVPYASLGSFLLNEQSLRLNPERGLLLSEVLEV